MATKLKTIEELFSQLQNLDIQLWVEGDRLKFNAPKGALTPELRVQIKERKAEIIAFLQRDRAWETPNKNYHSIERIDRDSDLPLSLGQERLWFLNQLLEGDASAAYNSMNPAWQLTGILDIKILEQSLTEIIRRHEVLRTRFQSVGGIPQQVIESDFQLAVPVIDLRELSEPEQSQRVKQLAAADAKQPFDLEQAPLLRASLLQLSDQKQILLLKVHHIAFDGWSWGILLKELSVIYTALSSGKPSPLGELPIQYADYAAWQRQWLLGEVLETQLNYWKQQLGGELPVLQLPLDYSRPPVQAYTGRKKSLKLSSELTSSLKELSKQEGVTLYMTLVAAFNILLSRYSGQSDIIVGTPISNRSHSEIECLIGFFVNSLALRTDLGGNPSFRELLARVREVTLGAYAHKDMPFEKLVEQLKPTRYLSHNPLFQVMFAFQNSPKEKLELPQLDVTPLLVENFTAKFDLSLSLTETQTGLQGTWEYNADLFEDETIERMIGNFSTLLEGIVADPEPKVGSLPLLTPKERHQLLVSWNDTNASYPETQCIHQLFEEQVERTPDAVAVVFESEQITYRELNGKANQLAHYLQNLGIGPDVLVGICVDRSIDMVVGLLGILKAGGAYVPLDPNYPKERLTYMLADSEVPVLLTHSSLVSELPSSLGRVVLLDSVDPGIASCRQDNPRSQATSNNIAYVIYTSGSTGRPKGVMVTYQGLCNLAKSQIQIFDVQQNSRILQFASFSFDASIWEIFMSICSGARLCMGTADSLRPGPDLIALLQKQGITHVTFPPSALATLTNQDLPSLQNIIVAGEACAKHWVEQWSVGRRFFNAYGPTEYTVCATVAECTNSKQELPIGRPIANTQIYILDRYLQPVPIGATGELHIGGAGLARGYLNRPELTSQQFIPNPFSNSPGSRLYKTGDLARYLPDGNIEFIGRIDNQVKIRGFRIEIGEIEAVLTQHPNVCQAVVIVREDIPGDKRLAAYIVGKEEVTSSELRGFLKSQLPNYMVPSAFVFLDGIPLTPNGKIDRRALPVPELDSTTSASFVGPQTPAQELLADIIASVLGIQRCGIHDNFFELGGHSLLATQVISRLRETFEVEIPLRSIFEAPTVAELEAQLDRRSQNDRQLPIAPAIERVENWEKPLSFAQERLWFLHQLEAGNTSAYNMQSVLQLTGELNIDALQQSLTEIIRRHWVLGTSFQSVGGVARMEIAPDCQLTVPVIDLRELSEPEQSLQVQKLAEAFGKQPFNLEQTPLLRGRILQLEDQKHVLLLNVHHIAFDGWSWGILRGELSVIYQAFSSGKPSPLAELPIQYADYAAWQRRWLQGEVLETQLNYWKQQLSGELPVLEMPLDYPRPRVQTYTGGKKSLKLSGELTSSLKELSRQEGVTLYMTLLAAFKVLLSRYSGQSDIIVGTPIANRDRTELEGPIGFFVNTLVLRTDLGGNPSFGELLGRVREVTLGAYAHKDMPFEKLVEQLQPSRDLSRNPLFQVWFDMVNVPGRPLSLPGVTVENLSYGVAQSKFDLTLYVREAHESIQLTLVYNAELFAQERIARMLEQWQYLLIQIANNPKEKIAHLSLVTPADKRLLPEPRAILQQPHYEPVIAKFHVWAQRTPQQPAISQGDRIWTYKQLAETAEAIAQTIQVMGVKPGEVVAVSGDRSFGLIASMMGILSSGAVMLAIDPKLPSSRQHLMLEQARANNLLYVSEQPSKTSQIFKGVSCIHIDSDTGDLKTPLDATIETSIHEPIYASDAAYIFFTSGTTGVPKGVLGTHQGLAHFLHWQRETFCLGQNDLVAQLTSLSFDAVLRDIFLPLTSGATLCLPTQTDELVSDRIFSWLETEEISVLHTVPALARVWLAKVPAGIELKALRWIFFAGEPLTDRLISQWRSAFPDSGEILNLYGPTETTMTKCYYQVPDKPLLGVQPIGIPQSHTQVLILSEFQQLCGIGEIGEIVLRTPFRTKGYINNPTQNQQRFVQNPYRQDTSDKLYLTGDLGRYRPDGIVEIIGRKDEQVKIRGIRIELGEIEAVLAQHPQVKEAVAIALCDGHGDKRLVAYVVAKGSQPVLSELRSFAKSKLEWNDTNAECPFDSKLSGQLVPQMRRFLREKLPEYMVPSTFVLLEQLPLTPNGKIDRRALSISDASNLSQETGKIAPRTTTELQLVQIWSEVLNIPSVGVRDKFFDLGGHSLLALRLIARIEQQFGTFLPLTTLFTEPTIEQQARLLRAAPKSQRFSPLVPIQPTGSLTPFFCIHPVGGNVLGYAAFPRQLAVEQPFYGLQSVGLNGEKKPLTRISDMAATYIKAIQTVQPQGPYKLGGWSFGGIVAFEIAQQLQALGHEVALLALIDSFNPTILNRPKPDEVMLVNSFAKHLSRPFDKELPVSAEELRKLGLDEQLNYILEEAKILELLPPEMEPEQIRPLFAVFYANIQAMHSYVPQPYSGQITLLNASEKTAQLAAQQIQGWSSLAAGGINIHKLPGDHFSIIRSEALAKQLGLYLGC